MFGLFKDCEDSDENEDGTGESGGCQHHHFEDYEPRDEYNATVVRQHRQFEEQWDCGGEWRRDTPASPTADAVDYRWVVKVTEKHEARCEHQHCTESDTQHSIVDKCVLRTELDSSPELREEYGVGDGTEVGDFDE